MAPRTAYWLQANAEENLQTRQAKASSYGAAVDLAFLTEMSNLSPPIIYPPPSAL